MKSLEQLLRPNIAKLPTRPSACSAMRDAAGMVLIDRNENPYNKPLNRYASPVQEDLMERLCKIKKMPRENIFLTNGSDEAVDLCYRIFCQPGADNVVAIEPTRPTYRHYASVNDVEYRPVLLDDAFQVSADKLLAATDGHTKIIWICSPNTPTGNNMAYEEIASVLAHFNGIVVVDEAYSDFSTAPTFRAELLEHPNLIVLNTMSHAWACAAIRLGMAFASKEIIEVFNKMKPANNIGLPSQQQAIEALDDVFQVEKWVTTILQERARVMAAFKLLPNCEKVYPSDANFFLVKMTNARQVYDYLASRGIMVSNQDDTVGCENCLRITIGTKGESNELLAALRQL